MGSERRVPQRKCLLLCETAKGKGSSRKNHKIRTPERVNLSDSPSEGENENLREEDDDMTVERVSLNKPRKQEEEVAEEEEEEMDGSDEENTPLTAPMKGAPPQKAPLPPPE